jgi:hypothetical protein
MPCDVPVPRHAGRRVCRSTRRQGDAPVLYEKSNVLILHWIPPGALAPRDRTFERGSTRPRSDSGIQVRGTRGYLGVSPPPSSSRQPRTRGPNRSSAASAAAGSCASTTGRRPEHAGESGPIVCPGCFYHPQAARNASISRVGARRLHRLAPVGFRAPLSEPGVHLSLCTGLSIARWCAWIKSLPNSPYFLNKAECTDIAA